MILVLDEATSHLDIGNEELVSNAIKHDQRTRVTVAHRPETIRMADRVVVIERGAIVSDSSNEQGRTLGEVAASMKLAEMNL